jgi:hypothetical protein
LVVAAFFFFIYSNTQKRPLDDDEDDAVGSSSSPAAKLSKSSNAPWKPSDTLLKWKMAGSLLLGLPSQPVPPSSHIASFDLDW